MTGNIFVVYDIYELKSDYFRIEITIPSDVDAVMAFAKIRLF